MASNDIAQSEAAKIVKRLQDAQTQRVRITQDTEIRLLKAFLVEQARTIADELATAGYPGALILRILLTETPRRKTWLGKWIPASYTWAESAGWMCGLFGEDGNILYYLADDGSINIDMGFGSILGKSANVRHLDFPDNLDTLRRLEKEIISMRNWIDGD